MNISAQAMPTSGRLPGRPGYRLPALVAAAAAVALASGCRTIAPVSDVPPELPALAAHERAFAQALANYAQGLLLEGERGPGSAAAVDAYFRADELDPGRARTAGRMAFGAIRQNEPGLAIDILEEAVRRHAGSVDLRIELASAYRLGGRDDDALRAYAAAIRIDPRPTIAYLAPAGILFARQRDEEALRLLRSGVRSARDPAELIDYGKRQGVQFLREGLVPRAVACLDFVCEFAPAVRRDMYHLIGELYRAVADTERAARYYELATREANPLPDAFLKLAAMREAGDPEAAAATLRPAVDRFPSNAVLPLALGVVLARLRQTNEADRALSEATARPAAPPEAFIRLAALRAESSVAQGLATMRTAAERFPDDGGVLFFLATLHGAEGQHAEASAAFERIRDIARRDTNQVLTAAFFFQYAAISEEAGQTNKAGRLLEEGLARYPNDHRMLNFLAYLWAEQGVRLDEALTHVRKALAAEPDNAAYVDTLGWIYYRQGRFDLALEQLKRANALEPDEPVLLDHLGDTHAARGEREQAVAAWLRSLAADPGGAGVRDKLLQHGVEAGRLPPAPPAKPATAQQGRAAP